MVRTKISDYYFYTIVNINNDVEDMCYVGHTTNWSDRKRSHNNACHNETHKQHHLKVYKTIRANGGWCEFRMVRIGFKTQLTLRQAEEQEEIYRKELLAELNSRRCYVSNETRKLENNVKNREKYQQQKAEGKLPIKSHQNKEKAKAKHVADKLKKYELRLGKIKEFYKLSKVKELDFDDYDIEDEMIIILELVKALNYDVCKKHTITFGFLKTFIVEHKPLINRLVALNPLYYKSIREDGTYFEDWVFNYNSSSDTETDKKCIKCIYFTIKNLFSEYDISFQYLSLHNTTRTNDKILIKPANSIVKYHTYKKLVSCKSIEVIDANVMNEFKASSNLEDDLASGIITSTKRRDTAQLIRYYRKDDVFKNYDVLKHPSRGIQVYKYNLGYRPYFLYLNQRIRKLMNQQIKDIEKHRINVIVELNKINSLVKI